MKKMSFDEIVKLFKEINEKKLEHKEAVIVFTEDSFGELYSLEERSYKIDSSSKVFNPNAIGFSLRGNSLDGSDVNVRLDWYMEYYGIKDGWSWKVDYCYLIEEQEGK